jgi:transposase
MAKVYKAKQRAEAISELAAGETQKETANKIGVTQQTITKWKKDDEFNKAIEKATKGKLKDLAPKAVKTLYCLLDANSETVRLNTAKTILELTGFKPNEQLDINANIANPYGALTDAELRQLIKNDG